MPQFIMVSNEKIIHSRSPIASSIWDACICWGYCPLWGDGNNFLLLLPKATPLLLFLTVVENADLWNLPTSIQWGDCTLCLSKNVINFGESTTQINDMTWSLSQRFSKKPHDYNKKHLLRDAIVLLSVQMTTKFHYSAPILDRTSLISRVR